MIQDSQGLVGKSFAQSADSVHLQRDNKSLDAILRANEDALMVVCRLPRESRGLRFDLLLVTCLYNATIDKIKVNNNLNRKNILLEKYFI